MHQINYVSQFITSIALVAMSFQSSAAASQPTVIDWADLVPAKIAEDPFERLGEDQLQDLSFALRVRALIASSKLQADGADAREAAAIERRLESAGIDIESLLAMRRHVLRLRTIQGSAVAEEMMEREISIAAFVIPTKHEAGKVTECFLVGKFDPCSHATPPPPNQAIFMEVSDGFVLPNRQDPIRVTGRISHMKTSRLRANANGPFEMKAVYLLTQQQIEPLVSE